MKKFTSIIKTTIGGIFSPKTASDNDIHIITMEDIDETDYHARPIPSNGSEIHTQPCQLPSSSSSSSASSSSSSASSSSSSASSSSSSASPKNPMKNEITTASSRPHTCHLPSLELYKNSKDDYVINLDVSCILESILDDIVTEYYESNTYTLNCDMCEYYAKQLDYELALESTLTSNELQSVKKNVEGIVYKDRDFLFNLRSIKLYGADSIINGIRCGVFKTSDLITKIDTSSESFKCELFAMSFIGKGIIKPYNLVLPYIVNIQPYRKARNMSFSIQPRIIDSLTIYEWMKITTNKRVPINTYVSICISVCKSILFLHSNHIVHGDIKPGNILIQNTTNIAYLIDFGLSGIHAVSEGTGGTKPFCHPETRNVYNDEEETYEWTKNYKCNDLWSVAMLFATILIFRNCYNLYSEYPNDFFDSEKYISNKYLHHIPYHFRNAFQLILINPKHRINVRQINIRNFIDLLESGITKYITPFDI